jgi:hypothetical protein
MALIATLARKRFNIRATKQSVIFHLTVKRKKYIMMILNGKTTDQK